MRNVKHKFNSIKHFRTESLQTEYQQYWSHTALSSTLPNDDCFSFRYSRSS